MLSTGRPVLETSRVQADITWETDLLGCYLVWQLRYMDSMAAAAAGAHALTLPSLGFIQLW
jgi:hypothetical protein